MAAFNLIITIGWISFWLYWLISAVGAKRNTTSRTSRFIGIRLAIFVLVLLLIRTSIIRVNYSNVQLIASHNLWVMGIGILLFLSGLALAIWARLYLGRNWGMPMSLKQDPELITSGPYHFIRHPIYAGILLALLGSALGGSVYWLIILIVMCTYFIYSATVEEKIMLNQFPKIYSTYKKQTKMLIPFVF